MLGWTVLLGVVGLMLGIFTLGTLYIILSNIKLTIFFEFSARPKKGYVHVVVFPTREFGNIFNTSMTDTQYYKFSTFQ